MCGSGFALVQAESPQGHVTGFRMLSCRRTVSSPPHVGARAERSRAGITGRGSLHLQPEYWLSWHRESAAGTAAIPQRMSRWAGPGETHGMNELNFLRNSRLFVR